MNISSENNKPRPGTLRAEFRLLCYVWDSAKGNHLRIVIPMLIQAAIGLFPASVTYYIQSLISASDTVGALLNGKDVAMLLGLILSLTVVKHLSGLAQGYAMADVRRSIERRYVAYLALRQSGPRIPAGNDRHTGHRNMMAFSKESEMLTGLIPMVYRSFIQAPLTVISFMILMIWLSWQMSCVIALLVGVIVYCCVILRKRIKATRRRLYARMADLFQVFSDRIRGSRVLRFYDSRGLIAGKLYDVIDDSCSLSKRLVGASCLQGVATELLTYLGVLLFIAAMIYGRHDDGWRILLTYPLAIMYIRSEALKIISGYSQLAATESSVRHITAAFGPESAAGRSRREWAGPITEIEFRGISFSYPDGIDVLRDCSAVFRRDGLNVIAGESGAGKSTCLDIISMALDPDRGALLFSGHDSRDFTRGSVARHISIVEQEPFLFEGTFLDNLTFGAEISPRKIIGLCREFNLGHVIATEADLLKEVADSGLNLSVGEKQRLSFIRAILKQPDVILLDEATSSVDSETSSAMIGYIKKNCRSVLTVCVSHDPATIGEADTLFRISQGALITIKTQHSARQ